MLLWYGVGVHVIEGAFQEHTEPCLIARRYLDALPMLLGVECGSTSGAGVRMASPRKVSAAAWQSRLGRRFDNRKGYTVDQRRGTALEKSRSALGQVRWVMIVWGGRKQVATERAVEANGVLLGLTSFQGTCSAVCS